MSNTNQYLGTFYQESCAHNSPLPYFQPILGPGWVQLAPHWMKPITPLTFQGTGCGPWSQWESAQDFGSGVGEAVSSLLDSSLNGKPSGPQKGQLSAAQHWGEMLQKYTECSGNII